MAFHVGQKVVCVDDENDSNWFSCAYLKAGRIYTIRQLGETGRGDFGVRLVEAELSAPSYLNGKYTNCPVKDNFYRASRFRPLTERKSEVNFTMGADPESDAWDNRRRKKERAS